MIEAANVAMNKIRRVRAGIEAEKIRDSRKRKSKEEVASLFSPYNKTKKFKPKKSVWKHRFTCLAYRNQPKIPTTDTEKDELLQAGLGEKEIEFDTLELTPEQFKEKMYSVFPGLREGGGLLWRR